MADGVVASVALPQSGHSTTTAADAASYTRSWMFEASRPWTADSEPRNLPRSKPSLRRQSEDTSPASTTGQVVEVGGLGGDVLEAWALVQRPTTDFADEAALDAREAAFQVLAAAGVQPGVEVARALSLLAGPTDFCDLGAVAARIAALELLGQAGILSAEAVAAAAADARTAHTVMTSYFGEGAGNNWAGQ